MSEILPLIHFFDKLRQNEFPLGVGEYERFLLALKQFTGLSLNDYSAFVHKLRAELPEKASSVFPKQELLRIVKLVWLKPGQSEQLFEDLFEEYCSYDFLVQEEAETVQNEAVQSGNTPKSETNIKDTQDNTRSNEDQVSVEDQTQRDYVPGEGESISQTNSVRIAVSEHNRPQYGLEGGRQIETEKSKFLFTRNYYPIDNRKLHQSFKQYPQYRLFSSGNEVDVTATVDRTIELGYLEEIVYKKNKVSISNLLVLIDHQGSMSAFEPLIDSICTALDSVFAASKVPVATNLKKYYFNNISSDVFYENKIQTVAVKIENVIGKLKNKSAGIIIISDAGAARMNYNIDRISKTILLLKKLQTCTKRIVWLNPFTEERWHDSSAEAIAKSVAMFPAHEKGIKDAVSFLKGSMPKKVNEI